MSIENLTIRCQDIVERILMREMIDYSNFVPIAMVEHFQMAQADVSVYLQQNSHHFQNIDR